jgi:hypothetical protein
MEKLHTNKTELIQSFQSTTMTLEKWKKLDFINKFHAITTIKNFDSRALPEGWQLFPDMGSFHYRPNGQFNDQVEKYIFPLVESEIGMNGEVAFGIPQDEVSQKDGVYYFFRKIP